MANTPFSKRCFVCCCSLVSHTIPLVVYRERWRPSSSLGHSTPQASFMHWTWDYEAQMGHLVGRLIRPYIHQNFLQFASRRLLCLERNWIKDLTNNCAIVPVYLSHIWFFTVLILPHRHRRQRLTLMREKRSLLGNRTTPHNYVILKASKKSRHKRARLLLIHTSKPHWCPG